MLFAACLNPNFIERLPAPAWKLEFSVFKKFTLTSVLRYRRMVGTLATRRTAGCYRRCRGCGAGRRRVGVDRLPDSGGYGTDYHKKKIFIDGIAATAIKIYYVSSRHPNRCPFKSLFSLAVSGRPAAPVPSLS